MNTLKSKILYNTTIQVIEKFIIYIIGFVSVALIAHHFSALGYGIYSTANNFVVFFALFADWGIGIIVQRDLLGKSTEERIEFIGNALSFRLLISLVIYGIAFFSLFFINYSSTIKTGILILLISQFIISFGPTLMSISQVHLNTIGPTIAELAGRIFAIALVILIVVYNFNIEYTFISILVSSFIYIVITIFSTSRLSKLTLKITPKIYKQIGKDILPIGLAGFLGTIYFKVDSVLLSFMKTTIDVGLYSLPYKLLEVMLTIPGIFMGLTMPILSKTFQDKDIGKLKDITNQIIGVMFTIALPMTVGVIMNAKKIILVIGGKSFAQTSTVSIFGYHLQANSAEALQILSIAVGLSFMSNIFGYLLIAINGQKQAFWRNLFVAIFNIVLNLIIIPTMSFIGTSATTVLSEIITLSVTYYITCKILKIRFTIPKLEKIVISTAIMTIIIFIARNLNIFAIVLLGVSTYALSLYLTGGIDKEYLKLLKTNHIS